jgi:hypothetical protein
MKAIIFEKYKLINLALFIIVLFIVVSIYVYVTQGHCIDSCSSDLKEGVMNPVFSGGRWFVGILGVLLLVPARIFRKWLFYVAPPVILLTYFLVQGISVHSGNLLNPTRAEMAENGIFVLAVTTAIFVIGHLIYDRRKKVNSPSK